MSNENANDPHRDARAVIAQAIADLKAAGLAVPIALILAEHALTMTTPTPTKSVKAAVSGQGHTGAL